MNEITHRQMRNDSAEVLRRVASGESLLVTNNGQPAAVIGPPSGDTLTQLSEQGHVREALEPPASLRKIKRVTSKRSTREILDNVRGRW